MTDSGMTPRVPRVAQSSLKIFPSIDRFWSKGATENACMICSNIKEQGLYKAKYWAVHPIWKNNTWILFFKKKRLQSTKDIPVCSQPTCYIPTETINPIYLGTSLGGLRELGNNYTHRSFCSAPYHCSKDGGVGRSKEQGWGGLTAPLLQGLGKAITAAPIMARSHVLLIIESSPNSFIRPSLN